MSIQLYNLNFEHKTAKSSNNGIIYIHRLIRGGGISDGELEGCRQNLGFIWENMFDFRIPRFTRLVVGHHSEQLGESVCNVGGNFY